MRRVQTVSGFSLIGLLFLVTLIGISAAAAVQLGAISERRQAEAVLLHVGSDWVAAFKHYMNATPPGSPRFPKDLSDLLKDPRFPGLVRHLRRVPVDPLTGKATWGLVRSADGYIVGVHSLSEARPIKVGNFPATQAHFETATTYAQWIFSPLATDGAVRSALSPRP